MEPPEKVSFVNREPLTDGVLVTMALTDTQREQLAPWVNRQGEERKEQHCVPRRIDYCMR
jgi:hypothetical protein